MIAAGFTKPDFQMYHIHRFLSYPQSCPTKTKERRKKSPRVVAYEQIVLVAPFESVLKPKTATAALISNSSQSKVITPLHKQRAAWDQRKHQKPNWKTEVLSGFWRTTLADCVYPKNGRKG